MDNDSQLSLNAGASEIIDLDLDAKPLSFASLVDDSLAKPSQNSFLDLGK